MLGRLAALTPAPGRVGAPDDFGRAVAALAAAARATTDAAVADEFHDLFIGVGRGELIPNGSYYLTGFLNEKPLAALRQDLATLGVARRAGLPETEDHLALLAATMAGLIAGAFGAPAPLAAQRRFFTAHIGSWAGTFFQHLEHAESARFYRPVGTLGRLFVAIETTALAMDA